MTTRRRLLRCHSASTMDADQARRQTQWPGKLDKQLAALKRWKSKPKRALNTVGRLQTNVARPEKRLASQVS